MRKLIAAALTVGWVVSLMLPVAVMGSGANAVWPGFATQKVFFVVVPVYMLTSCWRISGAVAAALPR